MADGQKKPKVVKFLFGWCKREEHDQCKAEKKLPADKISKTGAFHYICSCEHHKTGKAPDKVEA